jgi:hypothetical protein
MVSSRELVYMGYRLAMTLKISWEEGVDLVEEEVDFEILDQRFSLSFGTEAGEFRKTVA